MHIHVFEKQKRERKRGAKIGVDRLTKGLPPLGAILKWQLLMFKRQLAMPFSHMLHFQLVCVIIEFSWGLETLISFKMFLELYKNKPSNSKPSKPFY
jgi:hypothetical protein